jgi:hypothetical protein
MLRRVLAFLALSAVLLAAVGCGGDQNPTVHSSVKKLDNKESKGATPE